MTIGRPRSSGIRRLRMRLPAERRDRLAGAGEEGPFASPVPSRSGAPKMTAVLTGTGTSVPFGQARCRLSR